MMNKFNCLINGYWLDGEKKPLEEFVNEKEENVWEEKKKKKKMNEWMEEKQL